MENKRITLEDIAFLIKRLTEALEDFNEQVKESKVIYANEAIIQKKSKVQDPKIDEEVRAILRAKARILGRHKNLPPNYIHNLLNPTPSEFEQLKAEHIEFKNKQRKEKAKQRVSERRQLAVIDNKRVLQFPKLEIEDIKSDYILVCKYSEHGGFYYGGIGQITGPISFPLQLYKIKSDLSTGLVPMEIDNLDQIKALIDPTCVPKKLTKHLIELAVKHRVSFDGLKYLTRKVRI